jgi:hypothetical protein
VCAGRRGFGNEVFPVLRLKSVTFAFEHLMVKAQDCFGKPLQGPDVMLPGPLVKLGPVGLFNFYPFTVAQEATRLSGVFLLLSIYSNVR